MRTLLQGRWLMTLHSEGERLNERVGVLLSGAMGAEPLRVGRDRSPFVVGLRGVGLYAIVFCALPWFVWPRGDVLFYLSVWGACYFALAAWLATTTSASILKTIREGIVPELTEGVAGAIELDLGRRFGERRIAVVSVLVAGVAAVASFGLLYLDTRGKDHAALGRSVFLCCGYFVLYLTAARATFVARFYGTFAAHLRQESREIYRLDPAHSVLVKRIAGLGWRVLMFWVGIACLVATLVPFSTLGAKHFVDFVVPVASFFSVVFGTFVFMQNESNLRSVVDRVAEGTLCAAEREIAELYDRRGDLDDVGLARLGALTAVHERIWTRGFYRSALTSSLSFVVPLIGPAAKFLWPYVKTALHLP